MSPNIFPHFLKNDPARAARPIWMGSEVEASRGVPNDHLDAEIDVGVAPCWGAYISCLETKSASQGIRRLGGVVGTVGHCVDSSRSWSVQNYQRQHALQIGLLCTNEKHKGEAEGKKIC